MDKLIGSSIAKAFAVRADKFDIFRKVAIEGYDISFLITETHLEKFKKAMLIDFIAEVIFLIYLIYKLLISFCNLLRKKLMKSS